MGYCFANHTNDGTILLKSGNSNPGRGVFFIMNDDLIIEQKEYNISCCKSYRTPRGRCYSCPEELAENDPDEEP